MDAPIVAITWQAFFAKLFETQLTWVEPTVLFIATWLAYSADRWLDGKRYKNSKSLAARHRIIQSAGHLAIAVWIIFAAIGLLIAVLYLDKEQLLSGIIFFAATIVYFTLHWISPSIVRRWLPREFVVALFFAVATSLFVLTKIQAVLGNQLIMIATFSGLCFLNILGVACWDFEQDKRLGEVSLATTFPLIVKIYPWICLIVFSISGAFALFNSTELSPEILFCTTLSSALLAILSKLNSLQDIRPTLADCALLTPLIFLLT